MSNRRTAIAEKALRLAIDEETAAVRADLGAQLRIERARVGELEKALASIVATAQNVTRLVAPQAVLALVSPGAPSVAQTPAVHEEPAVEPGEEGELSDDDNMGDGRWG